MKKTLYAALVRARVFLAYLWRRFQEEECLTSAVVLSYATLLAIVPLSAVALAVFSAFPAFEELTAHLQEFIFRNFVPAAGDEVQKYVTGFAEKASDVPPAGVAFLVATALFLVSQVVQVFNRIWRVRRARPPAARLLVYWSALTVGPLLIGTSIAVSSYLVSLPLVSEAADTMGARRLLLGAVPFAIATLAFTLAFVVLPNRRVPWGSALAGGVLAAVLFEIAKWGFALYVRSFPAYELIYGALFAAVPIFLAWIYLSWVIVLLGATFAAALSSFRPAAQLGSWDERRELVLLYRLVGHLWQAQQQGEGRTFTALLACEPAVTHAQLDRLLKGLEQARLVHREGDTGWFLARDPEEITLLDLYRSAKLALPLPDELAREGDAWDEALRRTLTPLGQPLAEVLGQPLKSLYRGLGEDRD